MGSYRVDAGVLVVACAHCGAEMRGSEPPSKSTQAAVDSSAPIPPFMASASALAPKVVPLRAVGVDPAILAAQAASSADPFAAPDGRCPKCIAQRRDGELSCNQCGLTFVNFVKRDITPPPPLDQLWKELLAKWDDTGAHDRLLVAAVTQAALPAIARLYQIRLAVSPDDPHARRGRDEVLRLATASATATAFSQVGVPVDRARTVKIGVLMVGFVLLIMLSTVLIRQLGAASGP